MEVEAQRQMMPAVPPPEPYLRAIMVWLGGVLATFANARSTLEALPDRSVADRVSCADQVFQILGHRRFTHLSRSQAQVYKPTLLTQWQADMKRGRPLSFFYDLGPGYHASLKPDFSGLRFEPGLGELLALRQILLFSQAVQAIYAQGVRFSLVIDDLCAWVTNDVALTQTAAYLHRLEKLINDLGLQERVALIAESRLIDSTDYQRAFCAARSHAVSVNPVPTRLQQENVSRFVGRYCTTAEVADHLQRYAHAQALSERYLAGHLLGVRLTQRATPATFGFRAFSGGDIRHQCGEVDVLVTPVTLPRPVLTTYLSHGRYQRWPIPAHYLPVGWPLPPDVVHLTCPVPMPTRVVAPDGARSQSGVEPHQ